MGSSLGRSAVAILLVAVPNWSTAAELTGKVVIARKLTKTRVSAAAYNLRGAPAPLSPRTEGRPNEMNRVAVFLDGPDATTAEPVTVTLNQRNRRFEPELIIVPVGSTVRFPNSDPVFHNVFSLSHARQFDLGYYPQGQARSVRFDRAGVVQLYCHLHPSMYAAIVVSPTRWFASPSADGAFSWPDVPEGRYELIVWHNVAGVVRRVVHVPAAGTISERIPIPIEENGP